MRLLVLASLLLVALPAPAEEPAVKPFSVDLKDRYFRGAVADVFKDRATVRVEQPVPNVPITLKTGAVPLETAAKLLAYVGRESVPGLQLDREGSAFVYRIGTAAVPDPGLRPDKDDRLQEKISLDLRETTLRRAISRVFDGTGVTCVVMPTVADFPLRVVVKDVTVRQALDAVMEQAYVHAPTLYLGQEGPVYLIGYRRVAAVAVAPQERPRLFAGGQKGTVNIRDVGLRRTLRIMFRDSGFQHEVDPKLPDPKMRLSVRDVTLDEAIKLLIDEARKQDIAIKVIRKDNSSASNRTG